MFTGGLDPPPTVTTTGCVPGGTEALLGGGDTRNFQTSLRFAYRPAPDMSLRNFFTIASAALPGPWEESYKNSCRHVESES
jgi:hypothetical protein